MTEPVSRKAWAIIPARGGSKGIPRKNLQAVDGKSLIARAVHAAARASSISRVFVSTDNEFIAAEARSAGAEIIDRPPALAGDEASSESALLHALETLEAREGSLPELVAFLQCTSPFIQPDDIDGTIKALDDEKADSALTVFATHAFLWRKDGEGAQGINHDKKKRLRRQDRQPNYIETGAVYVMKVDGFRQARHRFFGRTAVFAVPALRAMEIDEPEDLDVARALAPLVQERVIAFAIPKPLSAIVFDFDGVMTDDRVVVSQSGEESVLCNRSDGLGIERLRALGIPLIVVSKEVNPVVSARCRKLKIKCLQGVDDKLAAVRQEAGSLGAALSQIIYIGNDINDLACMRAVGLGVAVADAHPAVLAEAGAVLSRRGGKGAVRELCDLVLREIGTAS